MEIDYQYIKSLVLSVQQGDNNAFAELYAATYQKQYRFAYNYLKDEFLAQDALQETYILVYRGIRSIHDAQLFIAWLNQICFRVCFKIHEKQKKYNETISSYEGSEGIDNAVSPDNPERQIVRIDQEEYMLKQVMNLPFSEAQALTFRYYHNMKNADIAKLMNVSTSSVKRYLRSGHIHLKKILSKTS